MSKKNYYHERNPLKMVLYILAVLALLGCIGYLLLSSGKEKETFQKEIERATAEDSNLEEAEERKTAEASKDEKNAASAANEEKQASVTPKATVISKETTTPEATISPEATVTPELTVTPSPAAEVQSAEPDKNVGVLVLNGTKQPGVAAYWKTKLEAVGYSNIAPATYNKTVGQETVIYASNQELAQPLLELFPNASVEVGTVTEGIELGTGVTMPEKCEVYIVVGYKDVNR